MSDQECIEDYYRPEIDNKGGRFDRYTDFQEYAINIANQMLQSDETFWEGFKRGFGIPIPIFGGMIEKNIENQKGHVNVMHEGAKHDVPGYKEATITVAGQEFKVLLDGTNPEAGIQAYTFSDDPSIAEKYAEEFQAKMNELARELIAERDAYIAEHGMQGYEERLHRFLNIELPNGIAGREFISPNSDDHGCKVLKTASNFDPMTSAAGPEDLIMLASAHIDVDQSVIDAANLKETHLELDTTSPAFNNLTV